MRLCDAGAEILQTAFPRLSASWLPVKIAQWRKLLWRKNWGRSAVEENWKCEEVEKDCPPVLHLLSELPL